MDLTKVGGYFHIWVLKLGKIVHTYALNSPRCVGSAVSKITHLCPPYVCLVLIASCGLYQWLHLCSWELDECSVVAGDSLPVCLVRHHLRPPRLRQPPPQPAALPDEAKGGKSGYNASQEEEEWGRRGERETLECWCIIWGVERRQAGHCLYLIWWLPSTCLTIVFSSKQLPLLFVSPLVHCCLCLYLWNTQYLTSFFCFLLLFQETQNINFPLLLPH